MDFANFRPIELKLGADSREVGFHRSGLDVVAHVNNVEAKHIWCGLDREMMLFAESGVRKEGRGIGLGHRPFKGTTHNPSPLFLETLQ